MARRAGAWLLAAGLIAGPGRAQAMQFEVEPYPQANGVILYAVGPVVPGDMVRLMSVVQTRVKGAPLVAMALDSPGGNVLEGATIADWIHREHLPVAVLSGSKCASICFLMFAASPRRLAASDANIGVHSATGPGGETNAAKATTVEMARAAGEYGVPPEIIGMMVQALPNQMEWLSPAALASMHVTILDGAVADQPPLPPPVLARSSPPIGEPPVTREAAAMPVPSPVPAPSPVVVPSPVGVPSPVQTAVSGPAFRGALFCRQGVRQMMLDFTAIGDGGGARGTLSFAPGPASRDTRSGSLVVEGRLDLGGGSVELRPTTWLSRLGDTAMIGLSGRSDDGGVTFRGQATSGVDCTKFTMKRTR